MNKILELFGEYLFRNYRTYGYDKYERLGHETVYTMEEIVEEFFNKLGA